jgi:Zn-dependent protease with chaperone function
MFAARCAGVSLAVFVVVYTVLSVAVSRGWRIGLKVFRPGSARGSADLLFVLRLLPLGVAAAVTVLFTLPSFLLLEPHATNEAIGAAPLGLGLCCLVLLGAGITRAGLAQWRVSQSLRKWLDGSTAMEGGDGVPVFRTANDSPSLTVAGVCAPKVLISEAAVALLNPTELRTALRHEIAHVLRYDNLKKLLFRFSVFPGMTDLEHTWSEETEMAADDAAVSSFRDALDLAAALIKVSRLGPVRPSPVLTTALLHSSTALSARVRRLVAWEGSPNPKSSPAWWYALPPAAVTLFVLAGSYGSVLARMHAVTEWLVR